MLGPLMAIVAQTSQAECREMAKLLTDLAEMPRDANWTARFRDIGRQFSSPQQLTVADRIRVARRATTEWEAGLHAEGFDHRTLIEAELQRRGDGRSVAEVLGTRWPSDRAPVGEDGGSQARIIDG